MKKTVDQRPKTIDNTFNVSSPRRGNSPRRRLYLAPAKSEKAKSTRFLDSRFRGNDTNEDKGKSTAYNLRSDIDSILPFVEKPSRYIGMEHGTTPLKKIKNPKIKICLAFPDIYEIGMSSLGMNILFSLLYEKDDVLVDCAYMPKQDLIEILRQKNMPISSLHYNLSLKNFDIIGFSLSSELSYTNVLEMLNLSQIPIRTQDRDDTMPLIIAGGGCSANPEPMADFIDAFVLGDGEEPLIEITDRIANIKDKPKNDKLDVLSNIEGVYIPSFYDITYDENGLISSINSLNTKHKPRKCIVKNLDTAFFPEKPIVPFVDVVHNHLTIEIQRGCFRGCTFCQAGFVHRPVRIRSTEKLKKLITQGLKYTGYDNVSLLSLSAIDYPEIEELLTWFFETYKDKKISISLPSLRCDRFSVDIAELVSKNKKSSLTFAPEAGSQKMRDRLNKNVTEKDIFSCVRDAQNKGWRRVKLYFMYGLPGETDEDISAIPDLVRRLKQACKGIQFNVTLSAFVPKSHTPFQWESQETLEELTVKKQYLFTALKKISNVKHSDCRASIIEGLLSRGNRRIGNVIETAWKNGACFDQWTEHFDFEKWNNAAQQHGISIEKETSRRRTFGEILPWSHLDFGFFGPNEKTLHGLAEKSKSTTTCIKKPTPCSAKKAEKTEKPKNIEKNNHNTKETQTPDTIKYRICYEKSHSLRFLSHLEVIEALRKTLRRTNLPLVYAHKFHPLPKTSFCPALPVGAIGKKEWFDIELEENKEICDVEEAIQKALPIGLNLNKIKKTHPLAASLEKILRFLEYEIGLSEETWNHEIFEKFQKEQKWDIEIIHKEKKRILNVKDVIFSLEKLNDKTLKIILNTSKQSAPFFPILNTLFGISQETYKKCSLIRTNLYTGTKNVLVEL